MALMARYDEAHPQRTQTIQTLKFLYEASMLHLIQQINNFQWPPLPSSGLVFIIDKQAVGFIRNSIIPHLPASVFTMHSDSITFASSLSTPKLRTTSLHSLLQDWRTRLASTNLDFQCLKGWRNEEYGVYTSHGEVLRVERAAQGIFGIRSYGCHLNGYVVDGQNTIKMWIARRSYRKQTWPGFLDNIVGGMIVLCRVVSFSSMTDADVKGGLPAGGRPTANMIKECAEEANIPQEIAIQAKPVSSVSYFTDSSTRGLLPDTEYNYDLQLLHEFIPSPQDGEVEEFFLWYAMPDA